MNIGRKYLPLTVNIVVVFLVIILCFAGSLTWYNFNRNTDAALVSARQLMNEISSKTYERLQLVYDPVISLAEQSAQIPSISQKPSSLPHPATWFLLSAMERTPQLYSAFVGWSDGEFYQLINYSDQLQKVKPVQGAPEEARYALRHIFAASSGKMIETWRFLDDDRKLLSHKVAVSGGYDPRKRPWYQQAIKQENVIKTNLYIFNSLQAGGVTMARRFDGAVPGVFGVDLTLSSLSSFLKEQEKGSSAKLLLFSKEGKISAHANPEQVVKTYRTPQGVILEPANVVDLRDPALRWLGNAVTASAPNAKRDYLFEVDGNEIVAQVKPVPPPYGNGEFIAVAMSVDTLVKPLLEIRENSLLFTLLALGIAAPMVIIVSWRISRPLRYLAIETEKIRDFKLDDDFTITSYVDEVHKLVNSVKTMKHALKTFSMYVPMALVRRLISSGVTPQIGGSHRQLTLMFTDVAGFTTLADGIHPQELMVQLSDYFEGLSTEIHRSGGTIDKYIGDAVMAFWNAPDRDEDHAKNACLAALRCNAVSQKMHLQSRKDNALPFKTRIGLHTGDVIVGNVGSSDRMDYTAIGSAVNMASRLEGLNKQYGTYILISECTAESAGPDFCLRPVDLALPKGAVTALPVFELIGLMPGTDIDAELVVDLDTVGFVEQWNEAWAFYTAREWEKATSAFEALIEHRSDDKAAQILHERCAQYKLDPPPSDWDGVTVFKSK